MDLKLLAWGQRRKAGPMPRLWLFTDEHRLIDPRASVARLPPGKAGVVLRHDGDPARAALALDLARICRRRRLMLVVAGDVRLAAAVRAGVHLRGGRWLGPLRSRRVVTSSAHSISDLCRARGSGAHLVFLSPAFATASHASAAGLGPLGWSAMVRHFRRTAGEPRDGCRVVATAALGGIDGRSVRRLPVSWCQAIGAIGALEFRPDKSE